MKKRRAYRLLAAVLAAVLLSGCAGKQESGKGDFKPGLDTCASVHLRVLGFFGNFEALDQVTNDFNRYYPNVTFSYGQVGGRDLEAYLDLNPGVDIMMVSAEFMNARNATLPARCRDLTGLDVSAIDEQMLKTYNIDGALRAIPMAQLVTGMVVNNTLLEKEGLSVPTNTQEFLSVLAALKEKGYTPIQGPANKVYAELTRSGLNAALCTDMEFLESARAGGQMAVDRLASVFGFLDIIRDNGYTDEEVNAALPEDNYDGAILSFFEGKTPFWICDSEKVSGMKKRESKSETFQTSPFAYSFVYVPFGEGGHYVYQEPWFGFAVNWDAANPEYAMEFLRFLATGKEIDTMGKVKGVPSVAADTVQADIYRNVESSEALAGRVVNTGTITPEITAKWYSVTRAYMNGKYDSPETAARDFLSAVE